MQRVQSLAWRFADPGTDIAVVSGSWIESNLKNCPSLTLGRSECKTPRHPTQVLIAA
jgi:hypothetical protein